MDSRAELAGLSPLEQEVLCALALAGDAEVTPAELAGLAGAADVGWAVDELVRRGLVRLEPDDRAAVRAGWRRVLDASDRARAILERAVALAETGRLSPETLLGLTEWALRARRYRELLAIVQAAQEALAVVRRVEAWIELLERARAASRALGDRDAEAWADRGLAALHRPAPTTRTSARAESALGRRLLTGAAVAAAGGAGLVVGLVALDEPQPARADPAGTTAITTQLETAVDTRTVTVATTRAVTVPGPVETVATTATTTVTVTVTVQPPPPPSPIG